MQTRVHASRTPTILYVGFMPGHGIDLMRLAGLRRYAATRGWNVETLDDKDCSPKTLRDTLARLRPIGCVSNYCDPIVTLRPALFGRVPVVYFNTPDRPGWRNARRVVCDEAAVARLAFKELSDGNPPSYAVLSCWKTEYWARERIDTFRECCRKAGAECQVAFFPFKSVPVFFGNMSRMAEWVAALPHRCAIFAVNDLCSLAVAKALSTAGRAFPRSVTLIGVDGAKPPPWGQELADTISTIRLDLELSGYLAAKMIASAVPPSTIETFPPLLVERRKSTRGYGRREPRILEAMEMIRREACDGLTAEKLAKRFKGTRRLFDLRFCEAMGHPPLDEILNVRMARAVELLANTDMPINAVADFCGFKSGWEFWDIFRKKVGMPPLRFRRFKRD